MRKVFVAFVCLVIATLAFADTQQQSALSAKALQFFTQIEDANFETYLKRIRPPKTSAEVKAQIHAQLAKAEAGQSSEKRNAKLMAAILPLLQFHDRADAIDIKVINTREAVVGVQGRAVLLISENVLRMLSTQELQAVVAHELGHEYFWYELMEARRQNNYERMREIELRCDGIAVIALERLGLDATKLLSALTKIQTHNVQLATTNSMPYPKADERVHFISAMRELVQARNAAEAMMQQTIVRK